MFVVLNNFNHFQLEYVRVWLKKKSSATMKIFQNNQRYFATLGINRTLTMRAYPLNLKLSIGFSFLGLSIISMLVYGFKEAKTFTEYTQCVYYCSIMSLIMFSLMTLTFNVEAYYDYINGMDAFINTGK